MAETTGTRLPPTAAASDHEDVAVLLKAATSLWDGGDIEGALRWFGRAAETASDVGDDRRALDLARAIADLKDQHAASSTVTAPPASSATMPPPPSARTRSLPPNPPPTRTASTAPPAMSSASPANSKGEPDAPGVRVSVKTSVRDPDLLVVRVLRSGQAPPSGCGEAILAPTGRGFVLASPRE